jgi:signal transduction histidine kinase
MPDVRGSGGGVGRGGGAGGLDAGGDAQPGEHVGVSRAARRRPDLPEPVEPSEAHAPLSAPLPLDESDPRDGLASTHRRGGRRHRLLAVTTVLAIGALTAYAALLGSVPQIDAAWRSEGSDRVVLVSSGDAALAPHVGQRLLSIAALGVPEDAAGTADTRFLQRSERWLVDDAERTLQRRSHARMAALLQSPTVVLRFADGGAATVHPEAPGIFGLAGVFWVFGCVAAALVAVGLHVALRDAELRHLPYLAMAALQAANLVVIGTAASFRLGLPALPSAWDATLRTSIDLATAAALVAAACTNPRRLPGAASMSIGAWCVAGLLAAALAGDRLPAAWWWSQGAVVAYGVAALGLLAWSYRIEPHPFAILVQRLIAMAVGSWLLLTLALTAAARAPTPAFIEHDVGDLASMVWAAFVASLLLLTPFLSQSPRGLREVLLLGAFTTIAASFWLLFVSGLGIGLFAAASLAALVSISLYATARPWILNRRAGSSPLSTERMFEQLYRVAREVEAQPERAPALIGQLLHELFEPLEIEVVEGWSQRTQVALDRSGMLVPVPRLQGENGVPPASVSIRFAQRGRHLFTSEDARLTDRVIEQLGRAVRFDQAVEQGRREERLRLAQDLHDDIGARLLTLIYQSKSPEMEDYLRHTLQDLKTLTRGLAASNHRLSHAAAEWKADATQRLKAAQIELKWSFVYDRDIPLTVVHWSALTRVLRELTSNAITHARARRVEVDFRLEDDRAELAVTDDGIGRNPHSWPHGLGLGGVRKRVKQLGGTVAWTEAEPAGIRCQVVIGALTGRG